MNDDQLYDVVVKSLSFLEKEIETKKKELSFMQNLFVELRNARYDFAFGPQTDSYLSKVRDSILQILVKLPPDDGSSLFEKES